MKSQLLIPYHYKKIGWVLLIPGLVLGVIISIFDFDGLKLNLPAFAIYSDHLFDSSSNFFKIVHLDLSLTIAGVLVIVGSLFICFSKEKVEDEFIAESRLNALQWAILINFILLLFAFIFIYGPFFLTIIIYCAFTPLLIFIIRFHYILYINQRDNNYEKQN